MTTELQTIADQVKSIIDSQIAPTLAAKRDAIGKPDAIARRTLNKVNRALTEFERCILWNGELDHAVTSYGDNLITFDGDNIIADPSADPVLLADALIAVLIAYAIRTNPPLIMTAEEARYYLAMPVDTFKSHVHRVGDLKPMPPASGTRGLKFRRSALERFREKRAAKA